MEEQKKFTDYYVAPHFVKSRECTTDDEKRILEASVIMYNLCFCQVGDYPGGLAVAHSQICDVDPLRFFVTADKRVIINPVITNQTKVPVVMVEGCLSFATLPPVKKMRSHKITVDYDEINEEGLYTQHRNVKLSGRDAQMFQHELDHFTCDYIYEFSVDAKE